MFVRAMTGFLTGVVDGRVPVTGSLVRAGFTVGRTNGQSLPVAELHPTAWREGQQFVQVDCCVDIPVVVHPAGRALPTRFTLEFRVHVAAVGACLAVE